MWCGTVRWLLTPWSVPCPWSHRQRWWAGWSTGSRPSLLKHTWHGKREEVRGHVSTDETHTHTHIQGEGKPLPLHPAQTFNLSILLSLLKGLIHLFFLFWWNLSIFIEGENSADQYNWLWESSLQPAAVVRLFIKSAIISWPGDR